ncbi:hypothetical protein [Streptomyces abikoensis]
MSLADEYGTDVEIYRRGGEVYADSRTGAPEPLLALLDEAGFTRSTRAIYTWHELPDGLPAVEEIRRCTLAAYLLLAADYQVVIAPSLYDGSRARVFVEELRSRGKVQTEST